MKFKVGEKVRVKKDLVGGRWYHDDATYDLYFAYDMEQYRGKVFEIERITENDRYRLKNVPLVVFNDAMLESTTKFKVGDIVKGTSKGGYCITDEKMTKGEVTSVNGETIIVKVLEHSNGYHVGKDFPVWSEYFELVETVKPIEIVKSTVPTPSIYSTISQKYGVMSKFITIGDITISIPKECPVGISVKDPSDTYSKEVGQSLALNRMLCDAKLKGLL